jgi:two-component system sensor kinase FixL
MGEVTKGITLVLIALLAPGAFAANDISPKRVFVTVRDSGTGLRGDEVGKIFKPFFTTKSDGLGMGLAISRSIIEAHGGHLWAENNLARGATFHFTLQFRPPR